MGVSKCEMSVFAFILKWVCFVLLWIGGPSKVNDAVSKTERKLLFFSSSSHSAKTQAWYKMTAIIKLIQSHMHAQTYTFTSLCCSWQGKDWKQRDNKTRCGDWIRFVSSRRSVWHLNLITDPWCIYAALRLHVRALDSQISPHSGLEATFVSQKKIAMFPYLPCGRWKNSFPPIKHNFRPYFIIFPPALSLPPRPFFWHLHSSTPFHYLTCCDYDLPDKELSLFTPFKSS